MTKKITDKLTIIQCARVLSSFLEASQYQWKHESGIDELVTWFNWINFARNSIRNEKFIKEILILTKFNSSSDKTISNWFTFVWLEIIFRAKFGNVTNFMSCLVEFVWETLDKMFDWIKNAHAHMQIWMDMENFNEILITI